MALRRGAPHGPVGLQVATLRLKRTRARELRASPPLKIMDRPFRCQTTQEMDAVQTQKSWRILWLHDPGTVFIRNCGGMALTEKTRRREKPNSALKYSIVPETIGLDRVSFPYDLDYG